MDPVLTIVEKVAEFWTDKLSSVLAAGNTVRSAFVDERVFDESNRVYPASSLQLLPPFVDSAARHGGHSEVRVDPGDNETMEVKPGPVPIRLTWQLDTYALKMADDWQMMEIVMTQLGSRQAFVDTPAGQTVYMEPELQASGDELEGHSRFRKIYRFGTTVWFDDPRDAQTFYLVLTRKFTINAAIREITAEAGG